jgi:PAS domain-containing protein
MTGGTDGHRLAARRYVEDVMTLDDVGAVEEIFAHPAEMDGLRTREGVSVETYEELQRYLTGVLSSLDDHEMAVDSVVVEGDEAMVRWEMRGRVSDELFGIPSTAERFETNGVTSFRFADGDIVEIHDHVNLQELMPEVAREGRRGLVREMRDPVVVIDDAEAVVDCNPAAAETFGRSREALLGTEVAGMLGDAAVPAPGESTVIDGPEGRRYFRVEASPLTDADGDPMGRTLVFHDVTEGRRHVQQLRVLNRVLRHNLRNDLTVVKGVLDTIEDDAVADSTALGMAREKADELLDTAETARQIREMLDEFAVERHDVGAAFDRLVRRTAADTPMRPSTRRRQRGWR